MHVKLAWLGVKASIKTKPSVVKEQESSGIIEVSNGSIVEHYTVRVKRDSQDKRCL